MVARGETMEPQTFILAEQIFSWRAAAIAPALH
jgi:hypothetical protein